MTSVTIPDSVTSIGAWAFYGCSGLTSVISKMENPCGISNYCFHQDAFYNATLYVPQGTIDKYKSTHYWNYFNNIVEDDDPAGIAQVRSRAIMLQSAGGIISVSGAEAGQRIKVYGINGQEEASATATGETTQIPTTLRAGETAIVKVGEMSVKLMMK